MRRGTVKSGFGRCWAIASLVAYGLFGVLGYAMHGLLPCGDGCEPTAAINVCCGACCHHAAERDGDDSTGSCVANEGAQHDAHCCPLCTLLAKIKVGQTVLFGADCGARLSYRALAGGRMLLPARELLTGPARGPPAA